MYTKQYLTLLIIVNVFPCILSILLLAFIKIYQKYIFVLAALFHPLPVLYF